MKNNQKGTSSRNLLVIIVIFILAIGVVWYSYHSAHKSKSTGTSNTNSSLIDYKSDKYGIQFSYPKSWGKAQLIQYPQPPGYHYEISFLGTTNPYSVTGSIDSVDSKSAFTKTDIANALKDKKGYIKSDSNSYATLSGEKGVGIDKNLNLYELNLYQTIDLQKANSTATIIATSLTTKTPCSTTTLDNSSGNCISDSVFTDINKFAKSIKSL